MKPARARRECVLAHTNAGPAGNTSHPGRIRRARRLFASTTFYMHATGAVASSPTAGYSSLRLICQTKSPKAAS